MTTTVHTVAGTRRSLEITPVGDSSLPIDALTTWLKPHVDAVCEHLDGEMSVTIGLIPLEMASAAVSTGELALIAPEIEDGRACVMLVSEQSGPVDDVAIVRAETSNLNTGDLIATARPGS